MKSFDDLRTTPESEPEVLNERFLRKVSGLLSLPSQEKG